ncbi:MAG: type II toxin-antitoxin system HicB family antitoxin [Microcystis panniformis WG22]|nr:type II toxin-antitoxin system HicB family antitoxin [Microcystis panniformis WG22]
MSIENKASSYLHFVECASLKSCVSQGKTKEEALINIKEKIAGYIAALAEDGLPIPAIIRNAEV